MGNAINRTTFLEAYDWADSIVDGTSVSFRLTNFGTTSINGLMKWWLLNIADFDNNEAYSINTLFSKYADGGAVEEQRTVVWGSTDPADYIVWGNQPVVYPV